MYHIPTGKAHPLDLGDLNPSSLCWLSERELIIGAQRGQDRDNLWLVTLDGNRIIQVTKEAVLDDNQSVSADGKKLFFMQSQQVGNIYRGRSDGTDIHQITFGDHNFRFPSMTADNKMIAYTRSDGYFGYGFHIEIISSDGTQRRELTSFKHYAQDMQISPDGKWIVAIERKPAYSADSSTVYLVDVANPSSAIPVTKGGSWVQWIAPGKFIVATKVRTLLVTIGDKILITSYSD